MLQLYFLTEGFYPSVGGVEIQAFHLAERLSSKGVKLTVITRKMDSTSADIERVGHAIVKRISPQGVLKGKGWRALGLLLLLTVKITYLLIKNRDQYTTVLVSGVKVLSLPAVLVSRLFRKNCIIKVESPMEMWEAVSNDSLRKMSLAQSSIFLKLLQAIRNPVVRRADRFVAISSEIKQELVRIGVQPEKIRSIPNGIDTSKFCPVAIDEKRELRRQLSLPVDNIILIFTGRLSTSKGVPLLIGVWEKLMRKYEGIHLVLVGPGRVYEDSWEDELREYIKNAKLEHSVSLTGAVMNVHEYLQAADIFIFPSEYEGFSLALTEALSCALPVIATRVGAAEELIVPRENGLLVKPKDEQELQAAVEWLLDHRDVWTVLGRKGRQNIVEKYSLEAITEKYLQMLRELERTQWTVSYAESA